MHIKYDEHYNILFSQVPLLEKPNSCCESDTTIEKLDTMIEKIKQSGEWLELFEGG